MAGPGFSDLVSIPVLEKKSNLKLRHLAPAILAIPIAFAAD